MNIGDRVAFQITGRKKPVIGTIRAFNKRGEARCDDGNPSNNDLHTNGFRVSAWVPVKDLEVVK